MSLGQSYSPDGKNVAAFHVLFEDGAWSSTPNPITATFTVNKTVNVTGFALALIDVYQNKKVTGYDTLGIAAYIGRAYYSSSSSAVTNSRYTFNGTCTLSPNTTYYACVSYKQMANGYYCFTLKIGTTKGGSNTLSETDSGSTGTKNWSSLDSAFRNVGIISFLLI